MAKGKTPGCMRLKRIEDSMQTWVKLNGCEDKPKTETLSKDGDEMKVTRKTYGGGKDGAVVVVIEDSGPSCAPGRSRSYETTEFGRPPAACCHERCL